MPVRAQGNTITGLVFQDYNADGFRNTTSTPTLPAIDPPVASVVVTAYDVNGQIAGSAVTGEDGQYTIVVNVPGPFRVEFSHFPAGLQPGFTSVSSQSDATNPLWTTITAGSTVQFVVGNSASNLSLALANAADYCQASPDLVTSSYVLQSTVMGVNTTNEPTLINFPYNANGNSPTTHALQVPQAAVGAIYGLAYERAVEQIYAAAYMKRFTAFGPNGPGAIYRVTRKPDPGQAEIFADLNAIFGPSTAGPDLHNFATHEDYKVDAPTNLNTIDAVGKTSLGGLAISDDEKKLYVMNLYDRQLYELPLDAPPTTANIRRTPVPLNQNTLTQDPCSQPATDIRPFAVEFYRDLLYIGLVCSGESSPMSPEVATWTDTNGDGFWNQGEPYTDLNDNHKLDYRSGADLHAYVYTVDPHSLSFSTAPVLSFPLIYPSMGAHAGVPAQWNPWSPTFQPLEGSRLALPQPILTGITFDQGNMILNLRDRFGDQGSYRGVANNPHDPTNLTLAFGATGDILRACGTPATGWTLENNATCGGITTSGVNDNQGPGKGEYYFQDGFSGHSETAQGGIVNVPGFPDVVVNAWDPLAVNTQGTRWLDNKTGAQTRAYTIFPNSTTGNARWGKGNGLGDLIALCDPAPMEIGNHIWLDVNGNGIQDANEVGIPGVTVHLYRPGFGPDGLPGTLDDSRALALAVSDAYGDYYFDNGPDLDPIIDEIGIVTDSLHPDASYEIRLDELADTLANGALSGLSLTEQQDLNPSPSGSALNDSNAVAVLNPVGSPAGMFAVITYIVGPPGTYDHSLDFGFTPSGISVGNQVWFDTNNNNRVDPQEKGIAGTIVDLFRDANTNGNLDAAEQTPIATQTTNAEGFYLFMQDNNGHALLPGNYMVGIAPANFATGGILVGYHTSGTTLTHIGGLAEDLTPLPNNNGDNDDNGQKQTGGFYTSGVLSGVISVLNDEPENEVPANKPGGIPGTTPGLSDPNRNNASNLTVDFGFYQLLLGDRVFLDGGNNGLRDGTDSGLNNLNLQLCAADGVTEIPVGPDGILGSSDDALGGIMTGNRGDGNGQYRFGGLPQGEYIICLTSPTGYTSSTGNPSSQTTGTYEPAPDPNLQISGKFIDNDDNGTLVGGLLQSQPVNLVPGDPHLPNQLDINYGTGTTLNSTVDFGLILVVDATQYSLGNRVWLDNGAGLHTNNGLLDSDERGASNLTVTLSITASGLLTPVATTKTDGEGYYRFSNLAPNNYVVEVAKLSGYGTCSNGRETDPNLDGDNNNNSVIDLGNRVISNWVTLGPGDSEPLNEADLSTDGQGSIDARGNMSVDFCFILGDPLSIGNQVYEDRNDDGYFDLNTEVGLSGVQVNLYADLNQDGLVDEIEAAQPYLTTTTTISGGVAGYYLFANLSPGNYVVELPALNFAPTGILQDYLSCSGKNASLLGPYEPGGDVDDSAQVNDTLDVGTRFVNPSTGENSIRTLPVTLQPNTEPLQIGKLDGDGVLNDGILDPKENPTFDNDPNTPDGNTNLVVDICLFKPYSLGNRVWFDANDNGNIDPDESGIASVMVSLYDVTNSLIATTTTDALGYYRFDYLTVGDYTVDVPIPTSPITHQSMLSSTYDGGDPDANPTDSDNNGVDLAMPGHVRSNPITIGDSNGSDNEPSGEVDLSPLAAAGAADPRANLTVDFGFYEPMTLGSQVFNDAENLCYRVSGQHTGLPGVMVYLYTDTNDDSIPDSAAIMSQTTAATGDYLFTNLRPGTYVVEVVPPPGFVSSTGKQGSPSDGPCEGANTPDPDDQFGGIDNDDNGITRADDRVFSHSITLKNRDENPSGNIADSNTNLTLDFGLFKPLSLGNLVWDDRNDDGLFDGGEPGLDGIVVNLYHDNDFDGAISGFELLAPMSNTVTMNNGQYLFHNLGRGTYAVELDPANFKLTATLQGFISSDGTPVGAIGPYEPAPDPNEAEGPQGNPIDNDDNGQAYVAQARERSIFSEPVMLTVGAAPQAESPDNDPTTPDGNANLTLDLGVYVPFSLGNRVWVDANNDGHLDEGEPGIAGVQIDLYQADGATKVVSTMTNAKGYYRFDALHAGAYIVEINATNFITVAETASGALLNYLSSTPEKIDSNSDLDSQDNGIGGAPDPLNGIRSHSLQLGLGGVEPVQETDLVSETNPQGSNDNFANLTADFGFYQPVCLGRRVWLDVNRNGIQDEEEGGLANVTVTLYLADGAQVGTMGTDAAGNYKFCNLVPGDYYVQFTVPPNYELSQKDQGSGDTQDSDADPTTGRTPLIPLRSGDLDLKWDAGLSIAPTALDEAEEPTLIYKLFIPIVIR